MNGSAMEAPHQAANSPMSISFDADDTIAAIATPGGPGLRGLVRLTGPDAWSIGLASFVEGKTGRTPSSPTRLEGVWVLDGWGPLRVSLGLWPGNRTYTGQPLVEVQAAGSSPVLRAILEDCLGRGARLAEPGEFTLRAFLSGRIDLTQSEAVLGVIDAANPAQLDQALRQLAGGLASPIRSLRDRLIDVLAHLEANLDFVDEPDVNPLGAEALASSLEDASREVLALAGQLQGRDRPEGRPRVVLVGPPNAGKSRLFNALVGESRALVSPVAGTTRDYLEARCVCEGVEIDLVDTAGRETAGGRVESGAQSARAAQALAADLLLDCQAYDARGLDAPESSTVPRLSVWTKADVEQGTPEKLAVSAATGQGLDDLRREIAHAIRSRAHEGDALAPTSARCGDSLTRAGRSIALAAEGVRLGGGGELIAVDLRQGVDHLGRVVGAVVTDDILDRIFRRFCIGK
jgi:tRNA modification GTPase